jgi:SAM-dependent methyltransferase
MALRFHEIAEAHHRILNPITESQLMLLGEICQITPATRQLDLCCGKAEMLAQWSARWGLSGIGVDISPVFLAAARARVQELGVAARIQLLEADARTYPMQQEPFDIVSCLGATWIGNGLVGTLDLLRPALRGSQSLLLIGEPYWVDDPPAAARQAIFGEDRTLFTTLDGTLTRFEENGFELIEMVLADHQGWDRYVAPQWKAVQEWLLQNPNDPEAAGIQEWIQESRRSHLCYQRRYLGWGVFVLRAARL